MDYEENRERIIQAIKNNELEFNSNYPGGAFWDEETSSYYNHFGQRLRDIKEYDRSDPEWTPFGDEGYDYY